MEHLRQQFFTECELAVESVRLATQAFLQADTGNMEKVMALEERVDAMEIEIEEECLKIIAMCQPLAGDLRFIVSVLKINNDLERISDMAVSIVKKVSYISDTSGSSFFLPEMTEKALVMLEKALDAFSRQDAVLAKQVCLLDRDVDELKLKMSRTVIEEIKKNAQNVEQLLSLMSNSRILERIADLSTNIAEDVIYMVEGTIIRHQKI
jgi:phosphate transport system protein